MKQFISALLSGKECALAGFGREGQSSYKLIRSILPTKMLTIIDESEQVNKNELLSADTNVHFITGENCMQHFADFDIVIKSPGIPSNILPEKFEKTYLTSQTDLFLQFYGKQVIGVTGTKGKSTTSSLIHHILKTAGSDTLLVGNIGVPPFDSVNSIHENTTIVMELSSHQLEFVHASPHIGILLNLFQEHLDHYYSYEHYQQAKINIARYQKSNDHFIYNYDNELLNRLVANDTGICSQKTAFSSHENPAVNLLIIDEQIVWQNGSEKITLYQISPERPLKGKHNLYNIMAAAVACYNSGVGLHDIEKGINNFQGLEHRIERVGEYNSIIWYNDSISTIPEATIEALKTLENVDTLILGGFDRGIDYTPIYIFLPQTQVKNLIWVGKAGKRMSEEFSAYRRQAQYYFATDYAEVVNIANRVTEKGKICLLSPAAASYDMFKNFEFRGAEYKKNVRGLSLSHSNS